MCPRPISTTTVARCGARLSSIGRYASSAWPETTTNPVAIAAVRDRNPRERRRGDGRADPRARPRTGCPAAVSASASSPPRPNTNGSPPFKRTTRSAAPRGPDQQPVDELLRAPPDVRRACRRKSAALPAPAPAPPDRPARRRARDRPRQPLGRAPRQQTRIAGPGADERDEPPARRGRLMTLMRAPALDRRARRSRVERDQRVEQQRPPLRHRHPPRQPLAPRVARARPSRPRDRRAGDVRALPAPGPRALALRRRSTRRSSPRRAGPRRRGRRWRFPCRPPR